MVLILYLICNSVLPPSEMESSGGANLLDLPNELLDQILFTIRPSPMELDVLSKACLRFQVRRDRVMLAIL